MIAFLSGRVAWRKSERFPPFGAENPSACFWSCLFSLSFRFILLGKSQDTEFPPLLYLSSLPGRCTISAFPFFVFALSSGVGRFCYSVFSSVEQTQNLLSLNSFSLLYSLFLHVNSLTVSSQILHHDGLHYHVSLPRKCTSLGIFFYRHFIHFKFTLA